MAATSFPFHRVAPVGPMQRGTDMYNMIRSRELGSGIRLGRAVAATRGVNARISVESGRAPGPKGGCGMFTKRRFGLSALLTALVASGCSTSPRPIIEMTDPLNGATAVAVAKTPSVTMASGSAVNDAGDRQVVLYDVTSGAHKTVAAEVLVEGTTISYEVQGGALTASHEFELEVQKSVVDAEDYEQLDGSESPEETLTWPFRLRFSTKSRARVRAAYLESSGGAYAVVVKFSQPMDPTSTGKAIQVLDATTKSSIPARNPIWLDAAYTEVKVELSQTLTSTSLYLLQVARTAVAADGALFDGNDNGTPGESSDAFSAQFTGVQSVIASRLPSS
jgi:hypothetical protein